MLYVVTVAVPQSFNYGVVLVFSDSFQHGILAGAN
jgi:hypothetical protein